jgi:hypothetical protein
MRERRRRRRRRRIRSLHYGRTIHRLKLIQRRPYHAEGALLAGRLRPAVVLHHRREVVAELRLLLHRRLREAFQRMRYKVQSKG